MDRIRSITSNCNGQICLCANCGAVLLDEEYGGEVCFCDAVCAAEHEKDEEEGEGD